MSDPRVLRSLSRLESDTLDRPDPDGLRRERKVEDGLTIFIPNWNHRTYLPRSIRSALDALECLEQAGYSAEVLVADDASRDGSQKLLRSVQLLYEEPRLKPLFLGRNLGLPRLRNLALQVSRYRYVCLMDADNQLVPENLPLFVRSIKETGAALVHGNLIVKRGDEVTGAWSNEVATMRLQERNYIDAFSVVDAQKLSSLGGYTSNSQLYGREDWEMVLHLIAEEEQIVFVPAVMGYYYTNPLSMIQEKTNVRGQETNVSAQESEALLQRMYAQGGTVPGSGASTTPPWASWTSGRIILEVCMDYEPLATDGAWGRLRRLDEYRDTVNRLFPALPKKYVDLWTLSDIDALVLGCLLDHYPREVVVLDVGTFVGASAFHFAGHPKVSGVIGVDPNPAFADEINDKSEVLGSSVDPEPLQSLRVLDVARAALAEFADEHEKIRLREGVVGSTQVGVEGGTLEGLEKVEVPEPSEDTALVAFVDGLHTREGVREDLEAIFERNPRAVALLDDCRHAWGPYVQAGVADFMEGASRKHRFRLLGDLGPGLATSGLGVVYPEAGAAEAERTLSMLRGTFSGRLDPLRLLAREEELIGIASELDQELEQARKDLGRLSRLEKRNSRLEKHNSQLIAHYSGRRFKLVDALVKGALRIPLVGRLMRRKKTSLPSDESS